MYKRQVENPANGFVVGGGRFRVADGSAADLAFLVGRSSPTKPVQGVVVAVFHRAGGRWFVVSLTPTSLAKARDPAGFATATVGGRAAVSAPVTLRCGRKTCSNYPFTLYAEDHRDPGTGADRVWLEVRDPVTGAPLAPVSLPAPPAANAATLVFGNVRIPL